MDQYPFKFEFYIIGMDVEDFIEVLKKAGYTTQVETVKAQFKQQLDNI